MSSLKRNIFWQYLLQMAIYVFPFITLPYLTRALGPDVYAIRAYAVSVMGLVTQLVSYGFNQWGTREVALHRDDADYLRRVTSVVLTLRTCLAVLGAGVIVALTSFVPLMAANPTYMFIAYVGACLSAMLPDFIFQGLQDMSVMTKRYVASKSVSLVLIFVFIHGPEDIVFVAVFEGVTSLVAFVWSWMDVVCVRDIRPRLKDVTLRACRNCFKSSTVFFLSAASTTIFTGLTTLMIGIYISDRSQVSYWSIATAAVSAIQSLYNPIVNSLYPHVVVRQDLKPAKRLLLVGIPVVVVGCVAFWLLADVVTFVLGGAKFLDGSIIVRLITPVLLFSFPGMMLGFPVLAAVGKEKWLTASSVISAGFHVAGLFALAALGMFTIPAVAILRSCTEFVLMAGRSFFVMRWRRERSLAPEGEEGQA